MTKILLLVSVVLSACGVESAVTNESRAIEMETCAALSDEFSCSCDGALALESGYCDEWPDGLVVCRGVSWPERDAVECD